MAYHTSVEKRNLTDFLKAKSRLSSKVTKAPRFEIARASLIKKIKKNGGFKEDSKLLDKFIFRTGDDFYTYKWQIPAMKEETLISFDNGIKASIGDFMKYCKKNSRVRLRFDKKTSGC